MDHHQGSHMCHCGKDESFEECCLAVMNGERADITASDVMRSRYSAFVVGNIDYLEESNHPETRHLVNKDELRNWANESKWVGLEIVDTVDGGVDDESGEVEFKAKYQVSGKEVIHHYPEPAFHYLRSVSLSLLLHHYQVNKGEWIG